MPRPPSDSKAQIQCPRNHFGQDHLPENTCLKNLFSTRLPWQRVSCWVELGGPSQIPPDAHNWCEINCLPPPHYVTNQSLLTRTCKKTFFPYKSQKNPKNVFFAQFSHASFYMHERHLQNIEAINRRANFAPENATDHPVNHGASISTLRPIAAISYPA